MPAKVFVSYSDRDEDFANKLIASLQARGQAMAVWPVLASTPPLGEPWGVIWEDHLRDALLQADTVIAIMSPAALDSAIVMMELGAAHAAKKPIIPVIPPRRSVEVSSFLPHTSPIKAGTRPIAAVARDVLDRIEDLVSTQATA